MKTETKNYPETPALDKMKSVKDKSQVIGEFLDWLQDKRTICDRHEHTDGCLDGDGDLHCGCGDGELFPTHKSIEHLLAEYFEIDLNACDVERRAVLEYVREVQ